MALSNLRIPFINRNKGNKTSPPMETPKADKPVERNHSGNLPDSKPDHLANGLKALIDHSIKHTDVAGDIEATMHEISSVPWLHSLVPGIEKLAAKFHIGNFVIVRDTNEKIFESMPIYARIGMHLLFYGAAQEKVLHDQTVEDLLKEQSIKEGKFYDSPESKKSIPSFVKTYSLKTDELLEPNLKNYKCFNDFFSRKLRPDARPVQNLDDPHGISSAADCRLTVFQSVNLAKQFWIKGRKFTIPHLLNVSETSEKAHAFEGASLAIFRLAPADYHRFHSPIDGVVGDIEHIPGQYYTVNPEAVNEPGFDVFTANTRSVLYLTHERSCLPVAFVAIGALLVGSIKWTNGGEKGKIIKRGEELGYFAYGGSTVVALFPQGSVEFDQDLVEHSKQPIETLVKVGYSIGKTADKAGQVKEDGPVKEASTSKGPRKLFSLFSGK